MVCSSLRISGHLPAAVVNGAGDRCENGRNSNFEGLVTLTFDPAILHTVVHHSSTSTYIPNFIQIEETFCGRTDVRTDVWTFLPSILLLGRLSEVDLKIPITMMPLQKYYSGTLCSQTLIIKEMSYCTTP